MEKIGREKGIKKELGKRKLKRGKKNDTLKEIKERKGSGVLRRGGSGDQKEERRGEMKEKTPENQDRKLERLQREK